MPKDYGSFCRLMKLFCELYDVLYLSKLNRSRCILYVFECPNGFCGFKMVSGFWFLVSGFWSPCNNKHARKVSGLGDVQKATNSMLSFFGILLLTVMFRHISCFIWYRQVYCVPVYRKNQFHFNNSLLYYCFKTLFFTSVGFFLQIST